MFGISSSRTLETCDYFSKLGYIVLLPDFHDNDLNSERTINLI